MSGSMTCIRQAQCILVLLLVLASPALAGPVRCAAYEEKTLNRLHTVCDDGTRAISTWSLTLQRWDTTITASPWRLYLALQLPHPAGGGALSVRQSFPQEAGGTSVTFPARRMSPRATLEVPECTHQSGWGQRRSDAHTRVSQG